MFATLPKTEINDEDSNEPIIETKSEFLNNYLVDGNFEIECEDQNDEDPDMVDSQSDNKSSKNDSPSQELGIKISFASEANVSDNSKDTRQQK